MCFFCYHSPDELQTVDFKDRGMNDRSTPLSLKIEYCNRIIEVPVCKGLETLRVLGCPNLRIIRLADSVRHFECIQCPSLFQVYINQNIKTFSCTSAMYYYVPVLTRKLYDLLINSNSPATKIIHRRIISKHDFIQAEMNWRAIGPFSKLRKLQLRIRRNILRKRLLRLIPWITELYFQPGMKGMKISQAHFESRANSINYSQTPSVHPEK